MDHGEDFGLTLMKMKDSRVLSSGETLSDIGVKRLNINVKGSVHSYNNTNSHQNIH